MEKQPEENQQQDGLLTSSKGQNNNGLIGDAIIKPLDGGWGWLVAVGQMIQIFFTIGITKSFTLLYLKLIEKFQQSDTLTSVTITVQLTTYLVFSAVTGMLCNRFEARSITLIGCVFFVGGIITSGYATSLYLVYLGYGLLNGIGMAMRMTPGMVILNQYFKDKKGKAFGLVSIAKGVASFTMPPFVAFLLDFYGWNGTLLILGGLSAHTFAGALLFRPLKDNFPAHNDSAAFRKRHALSKETTDDIGKDVEMETLVDGQSPQRNDDFRKAHGRKQSDSKTISGTHHSSQKSKKKKLLHLDILKNYQFLFFICGLFFFNCGMTSMTFLAPLGKEQGFSSVQITIAVTVVGVADLVGSVLVGFLFDYKRTKSRRYHFFYSLFAISGLASIGLGLSVNYGMFVTCAVVKGLTLPAFWMRVPIMADIVGDNRVPSAIALSSPLFGIGHIIGPIVGGLLSDWRSSYRYVMFFGGAAILVAAFLMSLGAFFRKPAERFPVHDEDPEPP